MVPRRPALRWRRAAAAWPAALAAVAVPLAVVAPLAGASRAPALAAWALASAASAAGLLRARRAARWTAAADAGLAALALTVAHALAAAGPGPALGAPLAGAVLVVVAARFPAWWAAPAAWGGAAGLALGHAALARAVGEEAGLVPVVAGLAALAALAAAAAAAFARERRGRAGLERAVAEHRRLRDEAEEYGALAGHRREPTAEDLSPRERDTRVLSAALELDRGLDRLLELGRLAVGARGLFLFLQADDPEALPLRRAAAPEEGPPVDADAAVRVGAGVIGHAARTRRAALFSNLDPAGLGARLWADGTPAASLLVVPVSEDGVFRGVLAADAAAPDAFGRPQERLLERFAGELGAQLAVGRAGARRERREHRLEALAFISQSLSSTIVLEEVLAQMVDLTRRVVPYDRCALFIADEPGRRLVLRAERGFGAPEGEEVSVPFERGLAGYIATHRREMLFTNLRERRRAVEIVPGAVGQERICSFLGLPLRHRESLVGVWVLTAEEPGRFDAEHLDVLKVVAAQAAVLISNAALHQTVERMAVTDGLTGLYNHRYFQERLAHELARAERGGEPVSLLLMDIDHFKKINDTHGHPFGDTVLRTLAAELGRLARRVDLVARYGGEEFALILVGTDRGGCRASAQRVLKAVRAIRIPRDGGVFTFTASLGAATWPGDGRSREELVRAADRALYAAKHGGRNRAVAHDELGGAR